MTDIVTFTINPAVDISTSVGRVIPSHKLRCAVTRRDAGGGGINVARVVKRFGADVLSIYTTGGPIGDHLHQLVDQENIRSLAIPISGDGDRLQWRRDRTRSRSGCLAREWLPHESRQAWLGRLANC